jgi:putative thioredoxin
MTSEPAPSPWIVEADDATFQREAVERSREVLVVVDFWAPWCGPCRMLGPMLEALARQFDGQFVLVKVDTDRAPQIAAGFGVQSIPAVYALRDGQLLDFFVGVLPEGQLRAWVERLLPSPAERLAAEARQLQATDRAAAQAKYAEASALDPNLAAAKIGLAELLLAEGRVDEAQAIVAELAKRGFLEPEAEKLQAELHMAAQAGKAVDLEKLRAAAADPENLPARLELAQALAAARQFDEALEAALALVQTHERRVAEPARLLMLDVFRLLGDDERVTDFRRRLSTALY